MKKLYKLIARDGGKFNKLFYSSQCSKHPTSTTNSHRTVHHFETWRAKVIRAFINIPSLFLYIFLVGYSLFFFWVFLS